MDSRRCIVAVAQVTSVRAPEENLHKATTMAEEARKVHAEMLVFPEYFMSWGDGSHDRESMRAVAQALDGPFVRGLASLARRVDLWIVGGVIESGPGENSPPFNTTVVLDRQGVLRASYRKSHLFDAFDHRESETFSRGDRLFQPMDTPAGSTGIFVCYELRFPEVARSQAEAGATVLIVPSGWVRGPLKDMHWETLVRCRAIENGIYLIGAAQVGNEFSGQSLIVDPMGVTLAQGGETEGVIFARIDSRRVQEVRSLVPSLAQRRPDLYR